MEFQAAPVPAFDPSTRTTDAGRILVVIGAPTTGSSTDLSHATIRTLAIDGISANDMSGFSVVANRDLNGDGLSDFLIATATGTAADLIYGRADNTDRALADVAAGIGAVRISGTDLAGMTVLGNVDLNRDGTTDLMLLAPAPGSGSTCCIPPPAGAPMQRSMKRRARR